MLPRVVNKASFLLDMLTEVFPDWAPPLFPDAVQFNWIHGVDYELPSVVRLRTEVDSIRQQADIEVQKLQEQIDAETQSLGFLHDLIRGTGDQLVTAVKTALETLGFQNIVETDLEAESAESNKQRREDLQIDDGSTLLLIEIKGVAGLGQESEHLQVTKYLYPRSRARKDRDVRGLAIINHQRNLPPHERQEPFGQDTVISASEQLTGLMTSWDLYRLTRSYLKFNWFHESIKSVFYQPGRIHPVPSHYEVIGTIQKYWPAKGVISIALEGNELRIGDRIAFDLPSEFEEQVVTSMQVNKVPVCYAASKQVVGIQTHITKEQAKIGTKVYTVKPDNSLNAQTKNRS